LPGWINVPEEVPAPEVIDPINPDPPTPTPPGPVPGTKKNNPRANFFFIEPTNPTSQLVIYALAFGLLVALAAVVVLVWYKRRKEVDSLLGVEGEEDEDQDLNDNSSAEDSSSTFGV
jgi:hypothetical protein